MNSNKINNSYETESSSSSNSLISAECLFNATSFNNNGENSLNSIFGIPNYKDNNFIISNECTENNDEFEDNYTNINEDNYNFDTFKNLENNLYKKDSYVSSLESEIISDQDIRFKNDINNFSKNGENIFVNENSSNAVDNALIMTDKINLDYSLTFDNLIKNIVNQKNNTVMIDITKNINCNNQITDDSKKSPSLFDEEVIDNVEPTNNNETLNNTIESCKSKVSDKVIDIYENNLLKIIKSKLSGVLPPPSVTTTQFDISTMLNLYLKNVGNINNIENDATNYIFKQTHNINDAKFMTWPECLEAKSHGLCYNYSNQSENIELLCLKYCERYIGTETTSSYNFSSNNLCSPSSTKKRTMRMKMLGQSPGRRLSHLARRRQFFNSITSVQSKTGSNLNLSNRQILVSNNNGKNKVRSTISDVKMVNSKHALLTGPLSAGPSRETSKRALFQSPPKNNKPFCITPELADRVGKSKRVLFSPSKNTLGQYPALNNNNKTNSDKSLITRANSTSCLNDKVKIGSYKRPSIDIIENQNKVRCTDFNSVIKNDDDCDETLKNSLKLARSQSFCASEKLTNARSTRTIFRTSSDIVTSKTMTSTSACNQILSDSHKKKLLWAVSQALQSKNINVTNENFKIHATTLARITKRLYIEEITENSSNMSSTSEKMLKLANRLAFYVIQGKTVDDIYQIEQKRIERIKLQKSFLNNKELGYITENDYKLLKNKINIELNLNISQSSSNELENNINNKLSQENNNANSKLILRENVDFDKRPKSTQKHNVQSIFSGKDQKNIQIISPIKSAKKLSTSTINKYSLKKFHIENNDNNLGNLNVLKAKRQISFDM